MVDARRSDRSTARAKLRLAETAMAQAHCFKVCELALKAQAAATRHGHLVGSTGS